VLRGFFASAVFLPRPQRTLVFSALPDEIECPRRALPLTHYFSGAFRVRNSS
jgi:hypothetical protein